jgi:exonuclease III
MSPMRVLPDPRADERREALLRLLDAGLVDVDVQRWGARRFTWWNPGYGYRRNLGMRLDIPAVAPVTAARLDTTWIDHEERGAERPSDHAALSRTSTSRSEDQRLVDQSRNACVKDAR